MKRKEQGACLQKSGVILGQELDWGGLALLFAYRLVMELVGGRRS